MPNTIIHKKSGTPGATPSAGSLSAGELAVNTADGVIYLKRDDGAVVQSAAARDHGHTASQISDFTSAVAAASPTEVLEFATAGNFPATGQDGKLYVATDSSRVYSWATSVYAEVGPSASIYDVAHTHDDRYYTESEVDSLLSGKQASGSYVLTSDARLTDARAPLSHAHGNITNAGAIGATENLPVITTTSGVLTTGSFGTTANTFCQGNDSRLSDSRNPTGMAGGGLTGSYPNPAIASGSVVTASLANDAVTYEKVQNVSATDRLLGRSSAGAGDIEEITCTAFARSVLDDADAATSRTTLGLGTIATQNSDNVAVTGGAINGTAIGATTASTGRFTTVTTSGNVGAGTASPAARLDVRRNNSYAFFCDSAFTTAEFGPREVNDGFCSVRFSWSTYGSGNNWGFDAGSDRMTWAQTVSNTRTEWMTLRSNNLGIGTNNPTISSGVGLHIAGSTMRLGIARTPASATATGNAGEVCWDSSYLYICTATNTWRRIAHSTW